MSETTIAGVIRTLDDIVQERLDWIHRGLFLFDRLFRSGDEAFARMALDGARDRAWPFAQELDAVGGVPRAELLATWDDLVAVASRLLEGRLIARPLLRLGALFERRDVAANIALLRAPLS